MLKNLPKEDATYNPYIIKLDGVKKAYVYDYELANTFYKALTSFKNAHVRIVEAFYKAVYVEEYEHIDGYTQYGSCVEFVPANHYIAVSKANHMKTGLVYNYLENPSHLNDKSIKILTKEALY